jgi:hypothetical protein
MKNTPIIKIDKDITNLDKFLENVYFSNNCIVKFDISNLKNNNNEIRSYFRRSVNYLRGISIRNNHHEYNSKIKILENPFSFEFKKKLVS